MDFIVACTGCYQSPFNCACKGSRRKHLPLTRPQYEKGLNDLYADTSSSVDDPASKCSQCLCQWCDCRTICNPCVKCSLGEKCLFEPAVNEINAMRSENDAAENIEAENILLDEDEDKPHDIDQYYVNVFEQRLHDHRTAISLKSRSTITIASETSAYVRTNVVVGQECRQGQEPSTYRSKLEVGAVSSHWWLSDSARDKLVTKQGFVSPDFKGELFIQVYNKTSTPVIVPAGAPIGSLIISCYEYYTVPQTLI